MEERTLEIQELFELFKKKIWVLIGVTFIITMLGVCYSLTMDTMYRARVKVYVGDSETIINSYTEDQMKYYSNFMNTFKEIIVIDDFLNETLEKNQIGLTADQVKSGLSFTSATNSPILEINYTSADQIQARDVLKALANEYTRQAESIMPNAKVQIVDSVKVFTIEPATLKVIMVAFAVGVIASIGLILVLDYLDDTIHKKQTLEKLLPVPVLGTLPHVDEKEGK